MSAPSLSTEAGLAGDYPSNRFNQRERKLLESVKTYVDSLSPDTVITTEGDIIVGNASGSAVRLAKGAADTVPIAGASTIAYAKIANANVDASAAIAYSKLNLATSIVNADVNASAAIAYSKLNLATSIVNADINASAAIAYSKLNLATSIVNADINGSAAIAYSKLNLANSLVAGDLTSGAVTLAKLHSGVAPSHVVKFAGSFTTAGGDANEQITVSGALNTDIAIVVLHTKGATPRTILTAQAATDAINLEFSGDPSTDHVVRYMVLRAAA